MSNQNERILEGDFYRLPFPRRSAAPTRIGEGASAVKLVGWPGEVRGGILLRGKSGVPAFGGWMLRTFALRRDPQPSVTPACPTSNSNFTIAGRSDKRGCAGRLRSSTSSKLHNMGRRRRRNLYSVANGRPERQQASQHFSQRPGGSPFESTNSSSTRSATKEISFRTGKIRK